ncbi:MAG: hypothetical protein IJE05_05555 [Clostridia bacterium]|nr:hypothetical protein [Clostridia bacterium]
MKQNKKNLLEKIVKKDYNNELEKILEEKQFGENVKSTLLSILYKIEAAYKDLKTVKKDVEDKDEYISSILNIIKDYCDSIKIIKMSDQENKIPNNKTYIVDKENKEIIVYPIDRKILYAIAKISKKDKIIKDDYFLINESLSNLINVGNNINMVEPLRDFNGYSWTCIPQEIESIEHNLVYQNLRMMVGYKFLNKWIQNNEFIIDYFDLFQEKLEEKYGKANKNKIIDIISKISILLEVKFNDTKIQEINKIKEEVEEEWNKVQNNKEFIDNVTKRKLELSKKIKEIDTIISDKDLLQKEHTKRNKKLPLEKKIFSMKILSKMMEEEREGYLEELEKLNVIINPQKFVKYKKEIEGKYKNIKVLDVENKEKELDKLKIQLQKVFLDIMKININRAETRQDVEKIIYDFRYYLLLPYDCENTIKQVKKLEKNIKEISEIIIDKAIELKVIEKISDDKETNYEILKNLFYVRIIKLEDAYLKITKEKEKYYVQIFDENIFEEKIEISKPKGLEVKPDKKISIWS